MLETMDLKELTFSGGTIFVPFILGMFFFSKWLFRDVQVKWGLGFISQLIFASTLAVSFQTHAAVLGEVAGILTRTNRERLWTLDFSLLIVLLKIIIPFQVFFAFAAKRWFYSFTKKLFFAIFMEIFWLFLTNWGGGNTELNLQKETEKLGIIGLTSVALLSGWGAVYGPYSYGPWFVKEYNDEEISRVQQKLLSVMEMRTSLLRRSTMKKHQQQQHYNNNNIEGKKLIPTKSTVFSRFLFGKGNNGSVIDTTNVESTEMESLSLLSTELFLEYSEMKQAKQANLFRKTKLGQIYTFLGYTFAGYCGFKMIASMYGIIFPKKPGDPDLITRVLSYVLLFARNEHDANILAQTISFVMVGVLVFNSFRGLLITVGKIFHQVGPRDSSLVSLLLTEIMGQYLLSSIILLDLNVPMQYRAELFHEKFEFFRVWSDVLFLISGFASILALYALDRAQGSRTEFYHTTLHEKII